VTILFGSRNPSERLFLDELDQWGSRKDIKSEFGKNSGDQP
jgi:hypothetical protein